MNAEDEIRNIKYKIKKNFADPNFNSQEAIQKTPNLPDIN